MSNEDVAATNRKHLIMVSEVLARYGVKANLCTTHLSEEEKIQFNNEILFARYSIRKSSEGK